MHSHKFLFILLSSFQCNPKCAEENKRGRSKCDGGSTALADADLVSANGEHADTALSACVNVGTNIPLGEIPVIKKFMKGVYELKPR